MSIYVPRLIPGRGFYAQISSEITSEFPGVTIEEVRTKPTPDLALADSHSVHYAVVDL